MKLNIRNIKHLLKGCKKVKTYKTTHLVYTFNPKGKLIGMSFLYVKPKRSVKLQKE